MTKARQVRRIGAGSGLAAAIALLAGLVACAPRGAPVEWAAGPPPLTIVDPSVEPGSPVAVARGEPRPVVYFQQPDRLSAPGEPVVLPPPIPHGDRQETLVEALPATFVVRSGTAAQGPLAAFLAEAGRGRTDALHLEVQPSRNRALLRTVLRTARRIGVDPTKIRVIGEAGVPGAVTVTAIRYAATAPVCPSLAIVGPSVNDNDFEPTLGCSNRANLAAMVNDPADLLKRDVVVPADGTHAASAVERYRTSLGAGPQRQDPDARSTTVDLTGGGPLGGPVLGSGGPVSR